MSDLLASTVAIASDGANRLEFLVWDLELRV